MNWKLVALISIFFFSTVQAGSISELDLNPTGRLNEKIYVSGNYSDPDVNSFVLCKFVVIDSNGFKVDRWSDEYTFSDGSFYAEKLLTEPPYYRGDSYDLNVSCGTASDSGTFGVEQPLSLTHPIQKGIENITSEDNLQPLMMGAGVLGAVLLAFFAIAFFFKVGKSYAG